MKFTLLIFLIEESSSRGCRTFNGGGNEDTLNEILQQQVAQSRKFSSPQLYTFPRTRFSMIRNVNKKQSTFIGRNCSVTSDQASLLSRRSAAARPERYGTCRHSNRREKRSSRYVEEAKVTGVKKKKKNHCCPLLRFSSTALHRMSLM